MKPYYRKKGKYNDGRSKIAIEKQEGKKKIVKLLPKPEIMLELLDRYGLGGNSKVKTGPAES